MDLVKVAEKSAKYIEPHMELIESKFKERNDRLNEFLNADHNIIGVIVKAHLIVEFHIGEYLKVTFNNCPFDEANLTFSQKMNLIPTSDLSVSW